jgi:hypothetical protein
MVDAEMSRSTALLTSPDHAMRIAEVALQGTFEPNGDPELAHVRRVAGAVASEARTVAWLHEVIERSSLTAEDLAVAGFSTVEVEAVMLLTRSDAEESDQYLEHVAAIARAPGRAGRLARLVKAADLVDRIHNPRQRLSAWVPPYAEALHMLESGGLPLPYHSRLKETTDA